MNDLATVADKWLDEHGEQIDCIICNGSGRLVAVLAHLAESGSQVPQISITCPVCRGSGKLMGADFDRLLDKYPALRRKEDPITELPF